MRRDSITVLRKRNCKDDRRASRYRHNSAPIDLEIPEIVIIHRGFLRGIRSMPSNFRA